MGARATQMDDASAPGMGAAILSPGKPLKYPLGGLTSIAAAIGTLPARTDTVIADVLARLLTGERMTGIPTVIECSSTRLAHHVHRLGERYGWHIDRRDRVVGCQDGRIATVTEYWLRDDIRAAAAKAGAAEWCRAVVVARAARRADAERARAVADTINAATTRGAGA